MSKQKSNNAFHRIIPITFSLLAIAFLVSLFLLKDDLNDYLAKSIRSQNNVEMALSSAQTIDSLYNYSENGATYQTTFLEFGAKGCVACTKMEFVMKEIDEVYSNEVNVVFLNILKPKNQDLMKYFGVSAIPTQILLDKKGTEYYRHTGYISFADLHPYFKFD